MSKKFFQLFLIFFALSSFSTSVIKAADTPIPAPVPIACPDEKNPEFNSLRPYQASPCGGSVEARMCSNDLIFIESFEFANKGCSPQSNTGTFTCNVNHKVGSHNLFVDLSNTTLPILGNTEQVKNSTTNTDSIDDATKMNEYVSWYLNGVNSKAEYGTTKNTGDSLINFSGPIQKIMPQAILDNQRIKTIETINITSTSTSDTGNVVEEIANHNQIVACASRSILGLIGNATPYECYKNGTPSPLDTYRLADWQKGDLGITRKISSTIMSILLKFPGVTDSLIGKSLSEAWNQRIPPVPWGNGQDGKPFDSYVKYQKAHNEWQGKSCVIIPFINFLFCFDLDPTNVFINSDWANLYSYVPLANTVDKKGVELVNGVQIQPSGGTQLSDHGYGETKNAPLFFAHTEEVKNLSEFLNSSYTPKGFTSKPLSETTEKNVCSAVNVRTNQGDNLFPEATHGIEVDDVYYTISQVECTETFTPGTKIGCGPKDLLPCPPKDELKCPAEVTITIKTDTKSPWLDNIFSTTVADSGSTFRKIFPKVGENAPVTCIADIPGVTNVSYDSSKSQKPAGGGQTFEVGNVPADGGATPDSPQLTFPHLGSVYDYFLKGIQTALRPKGYGEPVTDGVCADTLACGELPTLPKSSGSCGLGGISSKVGNIPKSLKDIINAAAQTYKVPPNLILGVMYGEGLFNQPPFQRFDWTDQNVKNWATCVPIPGCSTTGDDHFMGFFSSTWKNIQAKIAPDLKKLDPNKKNPSQCNLLDAIYGLAWNLHDSADGGMNFSCFGISLIAPIPSSCTWNNNQYESAIKIAENGFDPGCLTKPGSCASGGGNAALCPGGGDTCEKVGGSGNSSHNACVWDISHGK